MGRETTAILSALFALAILSLLKFKSRRARDKGQYQDGADQSADPH